MLKRFTGLALAAAVAMSAVPRFAAAAGETAKVWMPNPVRVWEDGLNRGLTAMMNEDGGVYLTWRLYADEDPIYGTAAKDSNVSFDIYRDGIKIATESETTNFTDENGTAASEYEVVVSGETPANTETVKPFESQSNYIEIPIATPAPAKIWVPESEAGATPTPEASEDDGESVVDDETAGESSGESDTSGWTWMEKAYTIGDTSCGDLDGDGEYELVVKWDSNPKDNAHAGHTGNVLLSAYKLDGTPLWGEGNFIDLGVNIRAGAHYTQFLVYDFDGDGKAEITCKSAEGSKGADGEYVTKASHVDEIKAVTDEANETNHNNQYGRITTGDEFFTIFDGTTGAALDTIYYPNQRVAPSVWGDSDTWGNRVDRFTAAVAFLDGEKPYAVYMRGYYYASSAFRGKQRQAACAVSFDKTTKQLECKYSYDSYDVTKYKNSGDYVSDSFRADGSYKGVIGYEDKYSDYYAQGNHNCSVADVDNDGNDEVLTGAMCYEVNDEDKLRPKWTTWKGHGDALHIGDYDPTHDGYEFFVVHEEGGGGTDHGTLLDYGMSVIDPSDGTILFHEGCSGDNGRGVMANVGIGGYYQIWSAKCGNLYIVTNSEDAENGYLADSKSGLSQNFRIHWDGDLYDELLNNTGISDWDSSILEMKQIFGAEDCVSVNGTKATPALQADLFGDWREEVVYPRSDNAALRIYTTNIPTEHKMKSLMYDSVYRCGVAAEQSGYNQPPHLGYYIEPENIYEKPEVKIPDGAEQISVKNAEDEAAASYSDAGTQTIGGLEFTINGATNSSKYYSVARAGLENNVFKVKNGYHSYTYKGVTAEFPETDKEQIVTDGTKMNGITFAVKLFDGTDGTAGTLYFLKNTTVDKYSRYFQNIITSVSTADLPEGEWGVVRYEFDGDKYYLYLNDTLLDMGSTDAGLPILGMPFTNKTRNGDVYGVMIFDDMYVYSFDNVDKSTAIYERGTESNPWTTADEGTWDETKNGSIALIYDTENQRLLYNPTRPKYSNTASKSFEVSEDASTLIYDLDWYFGTSPGGSNYQFMQFGSNLRFQWTSGYSVNLSTDGGESFTSVKSLGKGTYTKNIHLEIDLKDNTIKQLLFDGAYLKSYTGMEVTDPESISFGLLGASSTGNWGYNNGISKIRVAEVVNRHKLDIIKIENPAIRINYTVGAEAFDPTELVIKAVYDDGTEKTLDDNEYTISGFDSSSAGEKTITVLYTEGGIEKTVSFPIYVESDSVRLLDGRYRMPLVDKKIIDWGIGEHTGDFIIEHETVITSLPPDGSAGKDDTTGFLVKFAPTRTEGAGAGWYITSTADDRASVIWKSEDTETVAKNNIMVGETYTFRYDFADVGTGSASVSMSVIDKDGNVVAEKDGLSLRELSDGNTESPLLYGIVYLQSTESSRTDITISNARDMMKESVPVIGIDYENEMLTGFESDGSYEIDGAAVTAEGGRVSAEPYIGSTIDIAKKGGENTADSRRFTLAVKARPEKPSELGTIPETNSGHDGKITGTTADMEYSADGENWSDAAAGEAANLSAGTYYVRYKATSAEFASEHAVVTVGRQNEYSVVFMNGDEAVSTQYITEGSTPAAPHRPSREADEQYTYTFAGWSTDADAASGTTDIPAVTNSDVTYYAIYTKTVNQYTVTWRDEDGTEIASEKADYGTVPSYMGEEPQKASTKQHNYSFAGWADVKGGEVTEGALPAVTENADYYAVYSSEIRKYIITWRSHDGDTEQTLSYGTEITAPAENPAAYTVGTTEYTFDMWYPHPEGTVEGDAVYTAMYGSAAVMFDITYHINGHGSEIGLAGYEQYAAGTAMELPELSEAGWSFDGWYTDSDFTNKAKITESTTGSLELYAKWTENKYTVTWKNYDGAVLDTDSNLGYNAVLSYGGAAPVRNANAQLSYTFAGWTDIENGGEVRYTAATLPKVTEDAVYYAVYTETVNKYTVTWKNGDETIKTDENVSYGTAQKYSGAVPEKEADAQFTYVFAGWTNIEGSNGAKYHDATMPEVKGDVTYYAVFSSYINSYTVTFNSDGGSDVAAQTVNSGEKASVPENPEKDGYTFVKWQIDGADYDFNSAVTANITLKAVWEENAPEPDNTIPVLPEFSGKLKLTKVEKDGNRVTVTAAPEGDTALPVLKGYLAVYGAGRLVSVTDVKFGGNAAEISAPQLGENESCRLFIWTDENKPVTKAVTSIFEEKAVD